jgi:sulfatase maturation enzyme AslB (radical SAM superfamily)
MACTMISNTYALTRDWIERLNNSGLWMMQVSVDNLEPNDFSRKSWSKIKDRLELLRDHAKFSVNVNAVLGSSPPEETRQLVDQIRGLGFYMTVGLMHDDDGAIDPGLVGEELPAFYAEMRRKCRKSMFHGAGEGWEERMLQGLTAPYSCRAGARFLYIDEFGIVSYCSQKRGEPGIPIEEYSRAHRYEAYGAPKDCADQCTLSCVRRASAYDEWYPQKAASR